MANTNLVANLRARLDAFASELVADLEALIEERAVALVAERLGVALRNGATRSTPKRSGRRRAGEARKATGAAADRIVAYVRQNPGAKSEAVRAALKIGRGTWVYNVNKALDSKQIKRKGVKRASTLHPA